MIEQLLVKIEDCDKTLKPKDQEFVTNLQNCLNTVGYKTTPGHTIRLQEILDRVSCAKKSSKPKEDFKA